MSAKIQQTRRQRHQRQLRASLFLLLVGSASASFAQQPAARQQTVPQAVPKANEQQTVDIRLLPPLPIEVKQLRSESSATANSGPGNVRNNPYLRLRPVTTAVQAVGAVHPASAAEEILAGSEDGQAPAPVLLRPTSSRLKLRPIEPAAPLNISAPSSEKSAVVLKPLQPSHVPTENPPTVVVAAPPATSTVAEQPVTTLEPTRFTFSDLDSHNQPAVVELDEPADESPAAFSLSDSSFAEDAGLDEAPAPELLRVAPLKVLVATDPIELEPTDSAANFALGDEAPLELPLPPDDMAAETEPVAIEPAPQTTPAPRRANPHAKAVVQDATQPAARLYRPPRHLVIDATVASSEHGTTSSDTADLNEAYARDCFQGSVTASLTVPKAETASITPQVAVRRVQMQNRDICDAVLVSPHKLLLIGREEGTTRLAIWCGDASEPELREIRVVGQQPTAIGGSLDAVAKRLTDTIAATYPNSRVRVVPQGDGLVVMGKASDDRSAKAILRLVRSACLKTVNDQLEVR